MSYYEVPESEVLVVCQQTRYIGPMLGYGWADVVDGGPTLT